MAYLFIQSVIGGVSANRFVLRLLNVVDEIEFSKRARFL